MALVTTKNCITCHESFAPVNEQTECNNCKESAAQALREKHFNDLDNLSVEERLRRIEEWIYNYNYNYKEPLEPWGIKY